MKANKSRHLNKSVGMRKSAKINKRRAYAYSEDKSTSSESRLFADDFIISVSFLRLRYRESPNSADFGANRNRTKRGPLCLDQICSILVQKLAIFLEKNELYRGIWTI